MIRFLVTDEIRQVSRWMGTLTALAVVVVAVLTSLSLALPSTIGGVLSIFAVLVGGVYGFMSFLALAVLYYRSCYTTTAYLTASYPVRGRTIFTVKISVGLVAALLAFLMGTVLTMVSAGAFKVTQGARWSDLADALRRSLEMLGRMPAWLLVTLGVLFVVVVLSNLCGYYFAASVGSESWNSRLGIGGPILVWVGYYLVMQAVAIAGLLLPVHLVWPNGEVELHLGFLNIFTEERNTVIPLGVFIAIAIISVVGLWRAGVSYDKRLELR